MGTGFTLKCPNCTFEKDYLIGVGMLFPEVYEELVTAIKDGDYGDEWYNFFDSHPGAAVNAEQELYHCPLCGVITEDYNLDLYLKKNDTPPESRYVALWCDKYKYDFVRHYIHHCPNCNGRMHKVSGGEKLKPIPCPRCGTELESEQFCWD